MKRPTMTSGFERSNTTWPGKEREYSAKRTRAARAAEPIA